MVISVLGSPELKKSYFYKITVSLYAALERKPSKKSATTTGCTRRVLEVFLLILFLVKKNSEILVFIFVFKDVSKDVDKMLVDSSSKGWLPTTWFKLNVSTNSS